jgi:hypothetical protein
MWAGGPPKPVIPIRVQSRATVGSDTRGARLTSGQRTSRCTAESGE